MPGFLEGVREATRRHDLLLLFDEVVTGFRLAYGGAQEYYGVVPDLVAYGNDVSIRPEFINALEIYPVAPQSSSNLAFDPGPGTYFTRLDAARRVVLVR